MSDAKVEVKYDDLEIEWQNQEKRRQEIEARRLDLVEREIVQRETALAQVDDLQPAQLREWEDVQQHRAATLEADEHYRQAWAEAVERQTELQEKQVGLMERQVTALEQLAQALASKKA